MEPLTTSGIGTAVATPDSVAALSDDARVKDALHRAFDEQIPNFGGYNLVYGTGDSGAGGSFVIGFRTQPLEMVIAPIDSMDLVALEPAVSVDLTNVSHVAQLRESGFEVGVTTGRMFRFDITPTPTCFVEDEDERRTVAVQQQDDAAEFLDFLEAFMDHLDSIEAAGEEAANL